MNTHNLCFHEEVRKISLLGLKRDLSGVTDKNVGTLKVCFKEPVQLKV